MAACGARPLRAAARLVLALQAAPFQRARPAAMLRVAAACVLAAALVAAAVVTPWRGASHRHPQASAGRGVAAAFAHRAAAGPPASSSAAVPSAGTSSATGGAGGAPELATTPAGPTSVAGATHDPLPVGKGAWISPPANSGQARALAVEARRAGVTYLYVNVGSGSYRHLDQLVPAAHAAGLRVLGWETASLTDPTADLARAVGAIDFTAPGGQHLDGLVTALPPAPGSGVGYFATVLRRAAGDAYPLIAAITSSPSTVAPPAQELAPFDAVAAVFGGAASAAGVAAAVTGLASAGKPVVTVDELTGPATTTSSQVDGFTAAAVGSATVGVSFRPVAGGAGALWQALSSSPEFDLTRVDPSALTPVQIRAFQAELASLGYPVSATGTLDPSTTRAVAEYQARAKLSPTGVLDPATQASLLAPVTP